MANVVKALLVDLLGMEALQGNVVAQYVLGRNDSVVTTINDGDGHINKVIILQEL